MSITLGVFALTHIASAVALSAQESWPHSGEDWAMVLALSQGTVALEGKRVVGTAMVTPYGREAAAINMVIVDRALRGQGIGRRLMERCLAQVADRECWLTATEDGLPLYEKLGFRAVGTVLQHQGILRPPRPVGDVAWRGRDQETAVAAMDREASGLDRSALISALFAAGRVAVRRGRDGGIAGFAVLRRFGRGEVAGPVVAETEEDARALLSFVFAGREGAFLRVDTPEAAGLGAWLTEHGLVQVGSGIRMCRNSVPGSMNQTAPRRHTFALASQALG
jgi:GNAT superfamily N-acetyltransferase